MRQDQSMGGFDSSVEEFRGKISGVASDLSHKTLGTIKKYPLHTALAAAGIGFLVGTMVNRKES